MKKKLLLIVNPTAGREHIKNSLLQVVDIFIKGGYEVTLHTTQARMDACYTVRAKAGQYNLIVCSGGDGTLNEVTEGLMTSDMRPLLGYLPAGTTNDFANSIGIKKDPLEAARAIVDGNPFACDVGSFNASYFTYIAAFGLFTDVSYLTPQENKHLLGHLAYVLEGIKSITSIIPYHLKVTYDGETLEGDFIYGMVTNSKSIGGFKNLTATNIEMDDGLFEVALVKMPGNFLELQSIINCLLHQDPDPNYISSFRTSSITFSSTCEIPWTLDGEFGGNVTQAEIKNHKKAITYVV
ncbi:MAG: YegS/Rv2252/BmrU family lipid kinase [Oscillospiraceae bacterium]|nr:YegS/Rv2252/BmrU family lipid kinase [Oscillospiraceae bacterium]